MKKVKYWTSIIEKFHLKLLVWNAIPLPLQLLLPKAVWRPSRLKATFDCLLKTYGFLTPDFWRETRFSRSPFQEYTDLLAKPTTKAITYVEDVADIPA
ncbi:putative ribosomal protein S5 [Helianthus annuus]|uniref:Ribosomal protein S5 n=1 Tax=Helianthus annuus TaxID=4232 RepID=A0A9K3IUE5_HELAN|nr:putative ribosomal protein S5 [Helianthus annuus]KAJ0915282.1 putative ribosomal protein S5 [Helianthus annuus]